MAARMQHVCLHVNRCCEVRALRWWIASLKNGWPELCYNICFMSEWSKLLQTIRRLRVLEKIVPPPRFYLWANSSWRFLAYIVGRVLITGWQSMVLWNRFADSILSSLSLIFVFTAFNIWQLFTPCNIRPSG